MADPVLIISPYFAPRPRIGAQRATKFVRHLPAYGFEPQVVSLDAGEPGQSVCRLATPMDRTHRRSGSALGAAGGGGGADLADRLIPVDSWWPVMWWNRARVVDFAKDRGVRAVWSTGDPWSGHLLAETVADALDIPWIADWRDPWTLCKVRNGGRPGWVRAVDAAVEKRWMTRAAFNTFTSEETARRYRAHYGIRAETIHNAFDHDDISPGEPNPIGPRVDLVFFGRFRDLSPAAPVIRLLASCEDPAAFRVTSFGPLTPEDHRLAERFGVAENFVTEAPIPLSAAAGRLRNADFLLLSTDPRRDEIIPAKLWDYLPIGRPILSLAPNRDVERILAETGTGVEGDPVGILDRYARDRASMAVRPKTDLIRRYAANQVTEALATAFREVIG